MFFIYFDYGFGATSVPRSRACGLRVPNPISGSHIYTSCRNIPGKFFSACLFEKSNGNTESNHSVQLLAKFNHFHLKFIVDFE